MLYILIAGCFPFFGESEQEVMDEIANYRYSFNGTSPFTQCPHLKLLAIKSKTSLGSY